MLDELIVLSERVITESKMRYLPFGILRLVLALAVLISHLVVHDAFKNWLNVSFAYGSLSVFVFFVLSGFIITRSLDVVYKNRAGFFVLNRIVRLYPTYLFVFFIAVLIFRWRGVVVGGSECFSLNNILSNLFAVFPTTPITDRLFHVSQRIDLLSVVWALRIEFAFYIIIAAFYEVGKRVAVLKRYSETVLGILICICMLAYFTEGRLGFYAQFAPFFILGFLWSKCIVNWSTWVFLLLSVINAALYPNTNNISLEYINKNVVRVVFSVVFYLCLIIVVFKLAYFKVEAGVFLTIDRFCGELSYPVYLVHSVIIEIMLELPFLSRIENRGLIFCVVLVSTLLCSWWIGFVMELLTFNVRLKVRNKPN